MLIVIDLVGDDETVTEKETAAAEAKRLVDEIRHREEAYLEWSQRAPQPQVVPVER
jgi:hypothetical protein